MISIVINADTRPGQDADMNTVGDHGSGSLQGVRSWDFLTELPKTVHKFFKNERHMVLLDIDIHEPVSEEVMEKFLEMHQEGWFMWRECRSDHSLDRWNDRIYLSSLQWAASIEDEHPEEWTRTDERYIVHLDQDCAIFRHPDNDIVDRYLKWLDEGYKFICQSTDLPRAEHGMWWASTRFFICKRETLDFETLWKVLEDRNSIFNKYPWEGSLPWQPCLEHSLGVMAGQDKVLYPPREDSPEGYTVLSWVRYYKGLLKLMNDSPYAKVQEFVFNVSGGLCGPSDFIPSFPL